MSLTVSLVDYEDPGQPSRTIFIRENGQTKSITREEWDRLYPDQEPVTVEHQPDLYMANITHNLGPMANEAGIYLHLWRPEELGIAKASELINPLNLALYMMRNEPDRFIFFNPPNGWGSYKDFIPWLDHYLDACKRYPDASVRVSR